MDTGTDDALAILLALASPELEVLGITTVNGNVDVEKVTRNTLRVLELVNSEDILVAKGMDKPLSAVEDEMVLVEEEEVKGGEYFHGRDGLANSDLPSPETFPVEENAVDFIIRNVESNSGEISLITTAPLTNVAMAIQRNPDFANLVGEHIMMGAPMEFHHMVTEM